MMLKKLIVGILVAVVVVAAGTSWYNARADQSAVAASDSPAEVAEAAELQSQPEAVSTSAAESAETASPVAAAIHAPMEQGAAVQGQGAWGNAQGATLGNQGRGRSGAQSMQAGVENGTNLGEQSRAASGYRGGRAAGNQSSNSASGRPSWAGQGQGG